MAVRSPNILLSLLCRLLDGGPTPAASTRSIVVRSGSSIPLAANPRRVGRRSEARCHGRVETRHRPEPAWPVIYASVWRYSRAARIGPWAAIERVGDEGVVRGGRGATCADGTPVAVLAIPSAHGSCASHASVGQLDRAGPPKPRRHRRHGRGSDVAPPKDRLDDLSGPPSDRRESHPASPRDSARRRAQVEAAYAAVRKELGPIAIVIANAGISSTASFQTMSVETWQRMIDVNLTGVFHTLQPALSEMVAAKWGGIATISSQAAQSGARDRGSNAIRAECGDRARSSDEAPSAADDQLDRAVF